MGKFFSWIWGLFSGGGGIVSAVDDGFKLADDVTREVHDANQRTAGANAVIAKDNAKAAEVSNEVVQAMVNVTDRSTSDDLRSGNF